MSTTEERMLEWLNENIGSLTRYRASPMNAQRTAVYDDLIEQQRVAISAIETCRQLKKTLFNKENVTNDELVSMVLQLKSGRYGDREGAETEEKRWKRLKRSRKHLDGSACYENRVLTLEEVVRGEAMWYEERMRQVARVVILGYDQNEPGFTKLIGYLGYGFYRRDDAYNGFWRCWLRKPTKEEMEETPWEGDSHE